MLYEDSSQTHYISIEIGSARTLGVSKSHCIAPHCDPRFAPRESGNYTLMSGSQGCDIKAEGTPRKLATATPPQFQAGNWFPDL
jgi:hypothetical protein